MPAWLLPILAAAALGAGVFLLRRHLSSFERSHTSVDRKLLCPTRGELVEVAAMQEQRTGYFTEILSCKASGPALDGCSQACVQALNARAAARLAARSPEG